MDLFETEEALHQGVERSIERVLMLDRQRRKTGGSCRSSADQFRRHRDNRGGIEASAQLAQTPGTRRNPATDGFAEQIAEMILVFRFATIANGFRDRQIPESLHARFIGSHAHGATWRDGVDTTVRSPVRRA